eukprot:8890317-Pyramimonas_sp.AAC.1
MPRRCGGDPSAGAQGQQAPSGPESADAERSALPGSRDRPRLEEARAQVVTAQICRTAPAQTSSD